MPELARALEAAAVAARVEAAGAAGIKRVRLIALADSLRAQANSVTREV